MRLRKIHEEGYGATVAEDLSEAGRPVLKKLGLGFRRLGFTV